VWQRLIVARGVLVRDAEVALGDGVVVLAGAPEALGSVGRAVLLPL
jgi:hypothetical protein